MKIGKVLTELRNKKHMTQDQIADELGVKRPRYNAWENDLSNPDFEMLKKIAEYYRVSVDYLLDHTPELPPLTPKDERDIAKDIERILNDLENNEAMAFYGSDGDDMDEESKELLRISLEQSMRLAKQMAKKKFTPKKYRK